MITHELITARLEAMQDEEDKFLAVRCKERESLLEICGGLGHLYAKPFWCARVSFNVPKDADNNFDMEIRVCSVCSHEHEVVLRSWRR